MIELRYFVIRGDSFKWKFEYSNQYCRKNAEFNREEKSRKLKIITPKQMLQTLQIPLVQVKAGNTSPHIVNVLHQII